MSNQTMEFQIAFQQYRRKVVESLLPVPLEMKESYQLRLQWVQDQHILNVLKAAGFNRTLAADILGVNRRTLQRLIPQIERRAKVKIPHAEVINVLSRIRKEEETED